MQTLPAPFLRKQSQLESRGYAKTLQSPRIRRSPILCICLCVHSPYAIGSVPQSNKGRRKFWHVDLFHAEFLPNCNDSAEGARRNRSISWRRFAARRLLRIWPLYFAVLFSLYALGRYVPFLKVNGHAVFAFSVLLGNVYPGHLRVCEQFPE